MSSAFPSTDPLVFENAVLISYRLFDMADDIDLDRSQELLAGAATRLKLSRERSEYLEIPRAPLTVDLGERHVRGQSDEVFAMSAQARLFSFGALSIRYELKLPAALDSNQATRLVHDLEASRDLGAQARGDAHRLCSRLHDALDTPHNWEGVESYAILFARGLGRQTRASAVGSDERLARILLGEVGSDGLSRQEIADATQHSFSYGENDLCVVDWNTAVVLEPQGMRDIPDILEFATAQLLEFRFYDELVDREMEGLYSILSKRREPILWKLGGRYRRLGRALNRRLLETVEFVERVDNAIKIIADSYLARVYNAALTSFRVPTWLAGVNRKQDLLRQMAEVLNSESQVYTSHLLELIIILLILYEIVAPVVQRLAN